MSFYFHPGAFPSVGQNPQEALAYHEESKAITGDGPFPVKSTRGIGQYAFQSPARIDDEFTQDIVLAAGLYTFSVMGRKLANAGKLDWYLNDVLIVSAQDWYNGITVENTIFKHVNINVTKSGRQALRGAINGKNAGSSGYMMHLYCMWFIKE